jgi:hypothetical protein
VCVRREAPDRKRARHLVYVLDPFRIKGRMAVWRREISAMASGFRRKSLVSQRGRSMTIRLEAWRRDLATGEARPVTQAIFADVALGEDRRPRPLPPWRPDPSWAGRINRRGAPARSGPGPCS